MSPEKDPYGLVGTTIRQRYSVDYFVGVGRYSAVYRGTQLDTLCPVALKFLKVRRDLRAAQRPVMLGRMGDATAMLTDIAQHCPRFAELQEVGSLVTAEGRWMPFLVQTWLEGSPLEVILAGERARHDAPRSLGQAMDLLAPVADALAYAHARGVVHGSLAPRSLYVRENGDDDWCTVEVTDLGVSAIVESAQLHDRAFVDADVPVTSFVPNYGAPEQWSDDYGQIGPWTDVFALALILIELMTGTAPLGDGTDDQLEAAACDRSRRPTPRVMWLDLGTFVEGVFERALAVRPQDRFATVSSFWDALRAAHRMSLMRSASNASTMDDVDLTPEPSVAPVYDEADDDSEIFDLDKELANSAPPVTYDSNSWRTRSSTVPPPLPQDPYDRVSSSPYDRVSASPYDRVSSPSYDRISGTPYETISAPPRARAMSHPEPARLWRRSSMARVAVAAGAAVVISGGSVAILEMVDALGNSPTTRSTLASASAVGAQASSPLITTAPTPAVASPAPAAAPPARSCPGGMVLVPGGQFTMGSDELDTEKPAHAVTLSPYCLDANEVTVDRYKKCSDDGTCKRITKGNDWPGITERDRKVYDPLCNVRDASRGQHPMNCVDWSSASAFCAARGARLPTEAEWELAARGLDGRKYPWGDEEPTAKRLNACGKECLAWGKAHGVAMTSMYTQDDGWATTSPVGSFPLGDSPYGVHDLVGNVWEWTGDFYADYTQSPQTDPKGPSTGEARSIRGGAWNGAYPSWVRSTFRFRNVPEARSYGIGFRCARGL